ncbi:MAG: hypothetical protein IH600_07060 [Bacteroidetes bacterium]|nr:hypothetical protein [Bacteroidota bacterium]
MTYKTSTGHFSGIILVRPAPAVKEEPGHRNWVRRGENRKSDSLVLVVKSCC